MTPDEPAELSGDDKAYFESRGEKLPEPKEKPDGEAQATEEAETETDVLDDDKAADLEKVERVVPLRVLTKEREKAKFALTQRENALAEMEKKLAVLDDRWNTLLKVSEQQQEQPAVDEDPEPDPNVDIFKHNAWMSRQLALERQVNAERARLIEQEKQTIARENGVWNYWREDSAAYKAENPEFDDAVKWLSDWRIKGLKGMGKIHPAFRSEAGILQQINSELRDLVIQCSQQGIRPSEYIYNYAKEVGYTGKAPDPNNNPEAKSVEKLARDIDAETSLSNAGGSRPSGAQRAQDIADMSPEQFETWLSKNGSAGFKRLMQRGSA